MLDDADGVAFLRRWHRELAEVGEVRQAVDEHTGMPPPASPGAILRSELSLGTKFPSSYIQFLRISNGWPRTGDDVSGMRATENVGWFQDLEPEWLNDWQRAEASVAAVLEDTDAAILARSLMLSTPGREALIADPADRERDGEWAVYLLRIGSAGGLQRFSDVWEALLAVHSRFAARRQKQLNRPTIEQSVSDAYGRALAGDLAARAVFQQARATSWLARSLLAQFDAVAPPGASGDSSTNMEMLWVGQPGRPIEQIAADPVVMNELIPTFAKRLFETGRETDWEVRRAPGRIAEQLQAYVDRFSQRGTVFADFSATPRFAAAVQSVRSRIDHDLHGAWRQLCDALPLWSPLTNGHLAPMGLRFDTQLCRLLEPNGPLARLIETNPPGIELLAIPRGQIGP